VVKKSASLNTASINRVTENLRFPKPEDFLASTARNQIADLNIKESIEELVLNFVS
jgi:hypothetical protein